MIEHVKTEKTLASTLGPLPKLSDEEIEETLKRLRTVMDKMIDTEMHWLFAPPSYMDPRSDYEPPPRLRGHEQLINNAMSMTCGIQFIHNVCIPEEIFPPTKRLRKSKPEKRICTKDGITYAYVQLKFPKRKKNRAQAHARNNPHNWGWVCTRGSSTLIAIDDL